VVLLSSVVAKIEYNGEFSVKVKFMLFTVFDTNKPNKPRRKKRRKKMLRKAKKRLKSRHGSDESKKPEESKDKQTLVEKVGEQSGLAQIVDDAKKAKAHKQSAANFDFDMFKLIYDSAKLPVKHMVSRVRVSGLQLECIVGGSDAFKTAMSYGVQSALLSGGLAWLDTILKLKTKKFSVTADFDKEKTEIYLKCKSKLRLGTAVACIIRYTLNSAKKPKKSK
jgi:hypothetical protein